MLGICPSFLPPHPKVISQMILLKLQKKKKVRSSFTQYHELFF